MPIDWAVATSLQGLATPLTIKPAGIALIPPLSGPDALSGLASQAAAFDVFGSGIAGMGDGIELSWEWLPLADFRTIYLAAGSTGAPSAKGYLRRPDPLPDGNGQRTWGDYSGILHRPEAWGEGPDGRLGVTLRITRLVRLQNAA